MVAFLTATLAAAFFGFAVVDFAFFTGAAAATGAAATGAAAFLGSTAFLVGAVFVDSFLASLMGPEGPLS